MDFAAGGGVDFDGNAAGCVSKDSYSPGYNGSERRISAVLELCLKKPFLGQLERASYLTEIDRVMSRNETRG